MLIQSLKKELKSHSLSPSKGLGQNFLTDRGALASIIGSSEVKKNDVVVEVGPGTGILTKELLRNVRKVIVFEKDARMCQILKETLSEFKNLEVIHGDFLKNQYKFPKKYKVVANIPYYITSPLIKYFLEIRNRPEFLILMVQKEVARRICANPPNMSILAASVQFYAKAEIIRYVSKNSFWPKPKVDSAIIKITPLINANRKPINADIFFRVVKAGFSHPRKQLAGNLSSGLKMRKDEMEKILKDYRINPQQRAETLSVGDWINLLEKIR